MKISGLTKWLKDFINLLYPQTCECCGIMLSDHEKVICFNCLYNLPRTNFHNNLDNPVAKCFWGRISIEQASAYFLFRKGSDYQKLIHKLKYQNKPEIGVVLGKQFGAELKESGIFNDVDYIVPVPLHKKKLRTRGYNQSEMIAKGMAHFLDAEVNTKIVERTEFTATQTKKSRLERWQNVSNVFCCSNPELIKGKHILIIDDVLTTGATIEACANALLQASDSVRISVACLAFASD